MIIEQSKKVEDALKIARALPEWFNENGLQGIANDVKVNPMYVAKANDKIVGFLIYEIQDQICDIKWIGVAREYWRKHIGTKLVQKLEGVLKNTNVKELFVSTLSDTVEYEPYEKTRSFYKKLGFKAFKIDKDFYPDGGDRLLMRKKVNKI